MQPEIKATILSLISIIISLFAIYFKEYRILIISIASITLVSYILTTYINQTEKHNKKIIQLEESFKRVEDLIKIRANIEYLKKRIG